MSDEAKALYRKLHAGFGSHNPLDTLRDQQEDIDAITRALHAERGKVWEEALKVVEEYVSGGGTTSPTQGTLRKIATRLRAMAQEDT